MKRLAGLVAGAALAASFFAISCLCPVMDGRYAFFVGTMSTAIKISTRFNSMADDLAATVLALRRQHLDGAFKAIEVMRNAIYDYFQRLIIFVAANFTSAHKLKGLSHGETLSSPP